MKILKILTAIILSFCACFLAIGCGGENSAETNGDGESKGAQTQYSFYVGSTETEIIELGNTLKITAACGDLKITFSSKNSEIAEVDENGIVTAKAVGETIIEVKAGEEKRSVRVNVVKSEYGVTIDKDGVCYAYVGANMVMHAAALKNGEEYDCKISWSVSGNEAAKLVSNDKTATFSSTAKGDYVITATTADGASASITVKVIDSADGLN